MDGIVTSRTPCRRSRKGRTSTAKVTKLATGLPGSPRKCACPTRPQANGLPGLMAICHRSRLPSACTAGLMWSSSPTDTPPLVSTTSCPAAASRSAARVASRWSGTLPRSVNSQPRRCTSARRKKRLLLKMAPGGNCSGGTWPGMTSSSPVDSSATRGRRATGRCSSPMLAARPRAAGARRVPACNTVLPRAMSSPARRMFWPLCGWVCTRTVPSSCATQSSCMTTASAPGGTGAPVKIRAAVPPCNGAPTLPAAMRCDTGNAMPGAATSAQRSA